MVHRSGFGEAAGPRPFRAFLPEREGEPVRRPSCRSGAGPGRAIVSASVALPVGATETGTRRAFAGGLLVAAEPAAELFTPLFEADPDRYLTAGRLARLGSAPAAPLGRALALCSPDADLLMLAATVRLVRGDESGAQELLDHALDQENEAVRALRFGARRRSPGRGTRPPAAGSRTLPAENRPPESADTGRPVGDEGAGGAEARGCGDPEAALDSCATKLVAVSDRTLLVRDFRRVRVARRHQVSGHSGKQVPPHDRPRVSKQVLAQVSGQVCSQVLQQVGGQVGSQVCGWPPATSSIWSSVRFAIGRFRSRSVPASSVFPAGVGPGRWSGSRSSSSWGRRLLGDLPTARSTIRWRTEETRDRGCPSGVERVPGAWRAPGGRGGPGVRAGRHRSPGASEREADGCSVWRWKGPWIRRISRKAGDRGPVPSADVDRRPAASVRAGRRIRGCAETKTGGGP